MSDFPSLSSLLIQGNDHRLQLDKQGHNAYFCKPYPLPKQLRLGSSTASTISPQQWAYAQKLHASMQQDVTKTSIKEVKQVYTHTILQKLRQTCELPEQTHIQLADSGTDAHRLAMQHFCHKKPHEAWHIIMVDAAETGRGVPEALCLEGHHITCENIAIRQKSGEPLSSDDIEDTLNQAVQSSVKQGLNIVLLMVDVSKTGCIAPSLEAVLKLQKKHPQYIHILLDACQFRFGIETLNSYLYHDIAVIITGSKFLAAPSFCAALFIPHQPQQAQAPQPLGVLMRWHVALHNLQTLHTLSTHDCATFMADFTAHIQTELQKNKAFSPLPTPSIQRSNQPLKHWQNFPTIFPFFLNTAQGLLSHSQALILFKNLQCDTDKPIQLGRPMPFITKLESEFIGVFRLCMSAPLIIDAVQKGQQKEIIQQALHALHALQQLNRRVDAFTVRCLESS